MRKEDTGTPDGIDPKKVEPTQSDAYYSSFDYDRIDVEAHLEQLKRLENYINEEPEAMAKLVSDALADVITWMADLDYTHGKYMDAVARRAIVLIWYLRPGAYDDKSMAQLCNQNNIRMNKDVFSNLSSELQDVLGAKHMRKNRKPNKQNTWSAE